MEKRRKGNERKQIERKKNGGIEKKVKFEAGRERRME